MTQPIGTGGRVVALAGSAHPSAAPTRCAHLTTAAPASGGRTATTMSSGAVPLELGADVRVGVEEDPGHRSRVTGVSCADPAKLLCSHRHPCTMVEEDFPGRSPIRYSPGCFTRTYDAVT